MSRFYNIKLQDYSLEKLLNPADLLKLWTKQVYNF